MGLNADRWRILPAIIAVCLSTTFLLPVEARAEEPRITGMFAVSAGINHTCAIRAGAGTVKCWGNNEHGQLNAPTGKFKHLAIGYAFTCGIRDDITSTVACWGNKWHTDKAWAAFGLHRFTQISSTYEHVCALREIDKKMICSGSDWNVDLASELSDGPYRQVLAEDVFSCGVLIVQLVICSDRAPASPPGPFTSIDAESGTVCGITPSRDLACWGDGSFGKAPASVRGPFNQVSVGGSHTCAVRFGGKLECWGWDYFGIASPPPGNFLQVSAGGNYSCAIRLDLELLCWGIDMGEGRIPPGTGFDPV